MIKMLTILLALVLTVFSACTDRVPPETAVPETPEAKLEIVPEVDEAQGIEMIAPPLTMEPAPEESLLTREREPRETQGHKITFPSGETGKTEFNAAVYDVTPFEMYFRLPAGWTLRERETAPDPGGAFPLLGLWCAHDIIDEKGKIVGAVGYNTYEKYEGAEDEPRVIYSQIALGNDYQFDMREAYTSMKKWEYGETALCHVNYSASINDGEEKTNYGIVSYNRDLSAYVAMELVRDESDKTHGTRAREIADSIYLKISREPMIASALQQYGLDEYMTDTYFASTLENLAALDEWVQNYSRGIPGKVAVFSDNFMPYYSFLRVFESDGDASYTITEYIVNDDGTFEEPEVYESSLVIERAYDYIFRSRINEASDPGPILFHRVTAPETGEINFGANLPADAISAQEAEKRATENGLVIAFGPDGDPMKFYYKIVGTMRIYDEEYLVVYGHIDQQALENGEHYGFSAAVSTDGRFVFTQSMEDGRWYFDDDAKEKQIIPNG